MSAAAGRNEAKEDRFNEFHHRWCLARLKEFEDSPYALFYLDHPRNSLQDFDAYSKVIKTPMWIRRVIEKVKQNMYKTTKEWVDDMNLIWNNALVFNQKGSAAYDYATILKKDFDSRCLPVPDSPELYSENLYNEALLKFKKVWNQRPKRMFKNKLLFPFPEENTWMDGGIDMKMTKQKMVLETSVKDIDKFLEAGLI